MSEFNDLFITAGLPFKLETDLVNNKDEFKSIEGGHVKTLFNGEDEFAGMYANTQSFIMIDSLKQIGTYEEFLNSDNAGEVEEAKAYACYSIDMDDGNTAYIWGIWVKTQETGGPHHSGTTYYISFVSDNKLGVSYLMAEFSSGGDSPMWQEKTVTASFDTNKILTIHYKEVLEDSDTEDKDVSEKEYIYVFHEGKLIMNNINHIQGED